MILPRSLPAGLFKISLLYLADGRAANVCEIEIAPPAGAPPSIRGLSKADALAGEVIDVTGTGFTRPMIENQECFQGVPVRRSAAGGA